MRSFSTRQAYVNQKKGSGLLPRTQKRNERHCAAGPGVWPGLILSLKRVATCYNVVIPGVSDDRHVINAYCMFRSNLFRSTTVSR